MSDMGVPGGQVARRGGLVGPQGQNTGNGEGGGGGAHPLTGLTSCFFTSFKPPVYSTMEVHGNVLIQP